jgi:hypothetical protein
VKLSLKILGPLFVVLVLLCCGIGLWTGSGIGETVESTLFVLIAFFVLIVLPVAWLCGRRPWLKNLHRASPISDPQLGRLFFSFGFTNCLWRGSIVLLSGVKIPLAIAGSCDGPDHETLRIAKDLVAQFPSWQSSIEKALFEHYEPYAEALASGELKHTGNPLPKIAGPNDVWPLIRWVSVSVIPINGNLTTELVLTVPWDEEHTLGAYFQAGKFLELCGSV